MAGIIPGYNYDIFISYRQKDNKGDRWVSEFVEALKTELESTFKEEISVYFDINPHDGLLETHDVDESLKDKLKCLVFIPIISRTYCDPKSFAWEHEFRAFVELASNDQFGLKVKLPNSNVASRVLPISIYDLDTSDIKLCESVLGGVLRGVEFIYAEPGVNRPLKPDDDEKINLNKTKYRNQINKVGNAIKDIISAIEQYSPEQEEVQMEVVKSVSVPRKNRKTTIIIGSVIALVLIIFGILFIPKLFKSSEQLEKSIAVLPFINDSQDEENTYFINGIMEEVILNLQAIKALRVPGRTSIEQYRNHIKTIPQIARDLDVNYIVEASGQKYGNTFVLRVQLLEGASDRHLWGESYKQEIKSPEDIVQIQSQIAESIAAELEAIITPEEKQLIERTPTISLTAWDYYQRARDEYQKYRSDNNKSKALENAEDLYYKVIESDSTFARAYTGLAQVYWSKHYKEEFFSGNFLDSVLVLVNIALAYDDKLSEAYLLRGIYYRETGRTEQTDKEYDKAIKYNPNDWLPYYYKANLHQNDDLIQALDNAHKAASLYHGPQLLQIFGIIRGAYMQAGFPERAKYYIRETLKLDNDSAGYYIFLAEVEENLENYENQIGFLRKAYRIDSNYISSSSNYSICYKLGECFIINIRNHWSILRNILKVQITGHFIYGNPIVLAMNTG